MEVEIPDPQGELEFWSQVCDDDSGEESGSNDPGSEPSPAAPDAALSTPGGDAAATAVEVREDKAAARGDAGEDDRAGSRPGVAI